MNEVYETKDGSVIVLCDCGISHRVYQVDGKLKITSTYKKEKKETNEPEPKKQKSIFSRD